MNPNLVRLLFLLASICLANLLAPTPQATATTLTDLFAGATLNAGTAQFTDWQLVAVDSLSPPGPDLSLIDVIPLVDDPFNPGVELIAGGELSTTGLDNINLLVRFKVSPAPTDRLAGHELDLSDVSFGGNDGIAFVTADLTDGTSPIDSALAMADKESDFFLTPAGAPFAPEPQIQVEWDIFVTGFSGAVNLNSFTHRFTVTTIPEPTSFALLGLTALLALTRSSRLTP